ncbi:hypothetical protein TNIN_45951 [Trichonephila inaurata madagascariensis]|uniref:Uncharacterized protein n=1 Tax=Trichonephila inaurata madagascariensis TaxID=2747483 RepID=A0A8X6YIQ2_9ARAC|nr:hypothetical protein TNIN_45951 [Trichonephila inaurata madagascariensis]
MAKKRILTQDEIDRYMNNLDELSEDGLEYSDNDVDFYLIVCLLMTEKGEEYPIEIQAGSDGDDDCPRCNIFNVTNGSFSNDYIFNRLDTRVCLVLAYTFVFCCCFFGERNMIISFYLDL